MSGSFTGVSIEKEVSAYPIFFEEDYSVIYGSAADLTMLLLFLLGGSHKYVTGGAVPRRRI